MTGLDTVFALRALGRKDLVIGVTGWCTSFSNAFNVLNGLKAMPYYQTSKSIKISVLIGKKIKISTCESARVENYFRVLTKPVFESSLKSMLLFANQHRREMVSSV